MKLRELLKNFSGDNKVIIYDSHDYSTHEHRNFEQAILKFSQVIKQDANNAFAYYYRGLIYDEQKKYKTAVDDYNKFMSVYKTDDEYLQYIKARVEELRPFIGG